MLPRKRALIRLLVVGCLGTCFMLGGGPYPVVSRAQTKSSADKPQMDTIQIRVIIYLTNQTKEVIMSPRA
jgi:hypothetical protein